MIIYHSSAHAAHAPAHQFNGSGHLIEPYPEVPGRIASILEALGGSGLNADVREAATCDGPALLAVHDAGLLEFVRDIYGFCRETTGVIGPVVPDTFAIDRGGRPGAAPRRRPVSPLGRLGWYAFDAQTPVTEGTWTAVLAAAGCALAAARSVADGTAVAYAACRPPGHHAGRDFYGGYGFVNNAAIAARALEERGARVAVIDVDYHHGNGTQDIFYDDPRVLYVSLHADPDWAYPYFWGRADETGAPGAEGATRNVPLALETDDASYLEALDDALGTVRSFGPDLAVVSLGTDTSAGDPVGTFGLTPDAFAGIGRRIAGLRVPAAVVQEGGYDVDGIGLCVRRFFEGLLG